MLPPADHFDEFNIDEFDLDNASFDTEDVDIGDIDQLKTDDKFLQQLSQSLGNADALGLKVLKDKNVEEHIN
jgi:hypothetical protein